MDFRGLDTLIYGMLALLCVSVPLGLWKMIEIVIWLFDHVTIN